jgi:hypothetical protein
MNVLDKPTTLDETILDDEPACEFKHRDTPCSSEVTHILVATCTGHVQVCTLAAEQKQQAIDANRTFCSGCRKFAAECWRVVGPI